MRKPPIPADEAQRLKTLQSLEILDTTPEERFDRFTRMAKRLFGVPIALISLVDGDRQWFKSRQGLGATETPREISFCGHAILGDQLFEVPDASSDDRFADNPLVTGDPNIRFYAGYPIKAPNGDKMGTLCIIDREPRKLEGDEANLLHDLAEMVQQEFVSLALATLDELTGLSNRRGFVAVAEHSLALCHRSEREAALLFFDMDGFKEINDTFGHEAGDRALIEFAELLLKVFRNSDIVARMGGDEFCAFLTGISEAELDVPLNRLAKEIAELNAAPNRQYTLAYSVGAVFFDPKHHPSLSDMVRDADQYMYEQKQQKRAAR
jgi:diguanylate cyclase (GGDEF)-like protein